jgi:hypothetical protein
MLGDVAHAERTVQANNRDAKTIGVAEKAENFRQLNRTFFLKLGWHPHASVKHFNRCLNNLPCRQFQGVTGQPFERFKPNRGGY